LDLESELASLTSFLTLGLKDNLTKPLKTVAQALKETEANVKLVAKGMASAGVPATDKLKASLSKLKLSAQDIDAVSKAWQAYAKSAGLAANASSWTKEQMAGVSAMESRTVSALRRTSAEQARFFANQNRMARESRGMFSLGKPLAALGGPMIGMAVGGGMLAAVKEALGMGATTQERIAQLKAAGATPAEIDTARKDFLDFAAKHAGVTEADYLATYKDARVIAPAEAFEMAQLGGRYRSALRNSGLSTSEEDVGNVMRIMDELGMKGMPEREQFLNSFLKSQQAFGTQIQTGTALSAYRNAKQSIYDWSPEFREKIFPTLLQSTGQQGGTEMMTALNNYIGGHMQGKEFQALIDAGFVANKDVVWKKNEPMLRKGAHLFEADTFKSNIAQWAWDFHDHFMKRKGATEDQFGDLVAKMPRNMAGLIEFLVHNEPRVKRDIETTGKPIGLAAGDDTAMAQNPIAAFSALTDSLKQLASAATSPLMIKAAASLTSLAETIQSWATGYSEWAKSHPDLAESAGKIGVGVGGVGGLALLNGAFQGLMGGFGLKSSATALDVSAAKLSDAAAVLRGAAPGTVGGGGPLTTPTPGKLKDPIGGWRWLFTLYSFGQTAFEMFNAPTVGSKEWADNVNNKNKFWDDLIGGLLPPGWVTRAPAAVPFDPKAIAKAQPLADLARPDWEQLVKMDYGDRRTVFHDDLEQARENSRGTALSNLKPAADESKASLDALNSTFRPEVGTSSLQTALQLAQALFEQLSRVGAAAGALPGTMRMASVPSLGSTQRGSFTFGGVQGE